MAYAAFDRSDWTGLLALVDPDAAEEFKRDQVAFALMALTRPDEEESDQPEIDPDVAPTALLGHVFKVRSIKELEELPGTEVLLRFLRVKHARPAEESEAPSQHKYHVLGEVQEPPDLAHVVVRHGVSVPDDAGTASTPPWPARFERISTVDVLTLRRTSAGWRCKLNGGLVQGSSWGFSISFDSEDS